jgi:hypothetical protein
LLALTEDWCFFGWDGAYLDLAGRAGDGLDADAVVGVDDLGVEDVDGVDDVVVAAADGADGETVAAGAVAAREGDVGAAVDGEAVVLVVDGGAGDGDLRRVADVEGVGVVAALGVAVLVVDGDVVDLEALGVVDAEDLDGAVLDGLGLNVSVCTIDERFRTGRTMPLMTELVIL